MENDKWIRTKRGRPKLYFLDPCLGELSPVQIRERATAAAASHLLWNIMFAPSVAPSDITVRRSITEKEAWEIALREQYWPYARFESYLKELIDAGFLSEKKTR